jgi:hypothetical protein
MDDYLDALSKVHEKTEAYDLIKSLINEHFTMLEHMKKTSLYDVYMYEKRFVKNNFEPMRILANENKDLKKEVNKLRQKLGLGNKYKEEK